MFLLKGEDRLKWYEYITFYITDFIKDWIYPAFKLNNFLFKRYDLIKLHNIKRTDYCDIDARMFEANMELIKEFIEKEQPEKYVLWYKDENGNDVGKKYGEKTKGINWLYQELNGKWIMDIIKDIYNWYTIEFQNLLNDTDYIMDVYETYFNDAWFEDTDDGCSEIKSKDKFYTKDELEKLDIDWERIFKYVSNKEEILNGNIASNLKTLYYKLVDKSFEDKQYYLHLCIEVRPFLWT